MRVQVNGKTIELSRQDFLAQGGQGAIYVKRQRAFKIYTDLAFMIPEGKVNELAVLNDPKIIRPEHIIYNRNKPVGYTMRYVTKTFSLCQTFTQAFRQRNGITNDMSLDLVRNMQQTVRFIHSHRILIVDLNEMNFLVNRGFSEVYFIDVDNYQTPHYPCTAIMESIRDRHAKGFNEETDWFSFAVVSFQVLIGIHPYKGKHPNLKGLDARMSANVSIFNKDVAIPKCCVPLSVIPPLYRDWYEATFERGLREEPPFDLSKAIAVKIFAKKITGTDNFEIEEIESFDWNITGYAHGVLQHSDGMYVQASKRDIQASFGRHVQICRYGSIRVSAGIENDALRLCNLTHQKDITSTIIDVDNLTTSDGRLYIKSGERILEVFFHGSEHSPFISTQVVGNVLDKATKMYDGVVLQDLLGSWYASVFPESGSCVQFRLEVLDGYKIVAAKYLHHILMVVGVKNGKYDRFIFKVGRDIESTRKIEDVNYNGINFTVLDNGICVSTTEQETVEVFSSRNIMKVKEIDDPVIHSGMKLCTDGGKVMFIDGGRLYSIKMK